MEFFNKGDGAYFLVDGQYGSTGKGALAAYLAEKEGLRVDAVVTNAGPNSGHTSYYDGKKIVLKQLPTLGVIETIKARKLGEVPPPIYISSGAVINPTILNREVVEYGCNVFISDTAALISPQDVEAEGSGSVQAVAGTRQGVGAAVARKVLRDPSAIVRNYAGAWEDGITIVDKTIDFSTSVVFVEVSQGFSLGINSEFYPKVTSRECTVAQACADARIAPQLVRGVAISLRTYPIRVGNHEGYSSGGCYPDQEEIEWSNIGVEPELTTVTKRPRRLFTFSRTQYAEALAANRPTLVFMNFMNYLPADPNSEFVEEWKARIRADAFKVLGYDPDFLWGYGPETSDIRE